MSYDDYLDRIIPESEVWKYTYSTSHAPHYTMQIPCRAIVGTFAPVENIDGDPSRPFCLSVEKVLNHKEMDHVTVTKHDPEDTPFAEEAHHERVIPENRVWLMDMSDMKSEFADVLHAVHQLPNGTFMSTLQRALEWDGTPEPMGLSKEQVMEKVDDPNVSVQPVPVQQTPFKSVDE